MTQEEKARAYDKAIERAKSLIGDTIIEESGQHIAEVIFPELKESKDEKIRKAIHIYLDWLDGRKDCQPKGNYTIKDMIAWLERQGNNINCIYDKELSELLHIVICRYINDSNISYPERENVSKKILPYVELLEKQGESYTKKDVDNAYIEGMVCAKNELEKQGEQKVNYTTLVETGNGGINALVTREVSANDYEEKPANKVEPKFHESEWITNGDYTWKIVEVKPLDYILQSQDGNIVDDSISHVDEQFHSFTIKDAKDGDVLFHSDSASNGIFIFKEIIDKGFAKEVICYCDYDSEDHFCLGEHHTCCWTDAKILYPATKEQRDALMKAMTDAGYTFDFDKKELKKSNSYCQKHCKGFQETDKCFADGDCKDKREAEQNHAWSEDDEDLLFWTINNLTELKNRYGKNYGKTGKCITWLKTLKERIGGQIMESNEIWYELLRTINPILPPYDIFYKYKDNPKGFIEYIIKENPDKKEEINEIIKQINLKLFQDSQIKEIK